MGQKEGGRGMSENMENTRSGCSCQPKIIIIRTQTGLDGEVCMAACTCHIVRSDGVGRGMWVGGVVYGLLIERSGIFLVVVVVVRLGSSLLF